MAGLSAKQLIVLGILATLLYAGYSATRAVVSPLAALAVAVPVAGAAFGLVTLSRDGIGLDKLLLAAARFWRSPRRLAPHPGRPVPAWTGLPAQPPVGRLRLPAAGVSPDGVLDLGPDGAAVVCAAGTVNLGLRTPGEQDALVAAYGAWLNGLTGPVQILIRADRVNLTPLITAIEHGAGELADPGLEDAALEHGQFLRELAGERDLLRRQVLIVVREPLPPGAGGGRGGRDAARTRVAQRAAETAAGLAALGIRVTVLDGPAAAAVLTAAADPTQAPVSQVGLTPADPAVSAASGGRGRRRLMSRRRSPAGGSAPASPAEGRPGGGVLGVAAAGVQVGPRRVQVGDKQEASQATLDEEALGELSRMIRSRLLAWGLPESTTVSFDISALDLVVDGKARRARGKGMRGILHAALNLSLAEYCIVRDLEHPGFVVLDSPLVTYREPDGVSSEQDVPDEAVSATVADAFFRDLVTFPSQVIIIENTNPPVDLDDSARLVSFTATPGLGRYGLFPPAS